MWFNEILVFIIISSLKSLTEFLFFSESSSPCIHTTRLVFCRPSRLNIQLRSASWFLIRVVACHRILLLYACLISHNSLWCFPHETFNAEKVIVCWNCIIWKPLDFLVICRVHNTRQHSKIFFSDESRKWSNFL